MYICDMADFIDDAISAAALSMSVEEKENNAYRCELKSKHHTMIRTITMAEGYGAPVLGNLLYYYATEIQHYDDCDDILEWADDMDINPGDDLSLRKWEQLGKDHKDLRLLLGEQNYQSMMAALAISQAIDSADPR